MNLRKGVAGAALCAAVFLCGPLASASIIVTPGVDNTDTDNVINNGCDPHDTGPALTIQGCLNTDHDFFVNFTSDENIKYSGGGQAQIVAVDGAFSFLSISLDAADWTFGKLVLNIDSIKGVDDGFVTFYGLPGGASAQFALDPDGQNFFTITGEDFLAISFQTTVGIESIDLVADLKQVRIGDIEEVPDEPPDDPPEEAPEPGILSLMALALAALSRMQRRSPA